MLKIKPKDKDALTLAEFNDQTPMSNAKLARLIEVMIKNNLLHPSLIAYIVTGERVRFDAFTYENEEPYPKDESNSENVDLVAEIDLEDSHDIKVFYDHAKKRLFYTVNDKVNVLNENLSKTDALKHFENEYQNIRWNTRRSLNLSAISEPEQ